MVRPGNIKAGEAAVELFLNDSKLYRGLHKAQKRLERFGRAASTMGAGMMGIGAAIAAPLLAASKIFSKMGDDIAKMAKRTGWGVEALSEMDFVASQTGTALSAFENGVRRMQRSIYDAGRGLSTATDALDDLGVKYEDLKGLKPEEQFKLLADRIDAIKDPTTKAAIAMSLFGRSGTAMIPMFTGGAKAIDKLQKEARRLGLTMSGEDAAAAEKFTDTMDKLWKVIKMGAFHVGASLAPALGELADYIRENVTAITGWVNKNREMIVTILKTTAWVAGLGAALWALGKTAGAIALVVKAVKALCVAFVWLAANPIVAGFALLAATIVGVTLAIRSLTSYTADLGNEMDNLLAKGDEQRATDLLRMKRLQQLADKEKLNSLEMSEASTLISILENKYGDLGLEVDTLTKKIEGMTAAQKKANKAMREKALVDVEKEIGKTERRINELKKERESAHWLFGYAWKGTLDEIDKKIQGQEKVMRGLLDRWLGLDTPGGTPDLTGNTKPDREKLKEKIAGDSGMGKETDMERAALREIERLQIEALGNEKRRELKLLQHIYKEKVRLAKKAGASKSTLDLMEDVQLRKEEAFFARWKKEAADKKNQIDEQIADADLARSQGNEELALRAKFKGFELEKAMLALQKERAIDAAKAAGENVDLVKREFDLREQIMNQGRSVAPMLSKIASRGSSNAAAIAGMAAGGPMDKMVKGILDIAKNTKDTKRAIEEGGLAFT